MGRGPPYLICDIRGSVVKAEAGGAEARLVLSGNKWCDKLRDEAVAHGLERLAAYNVYCPVISHIKVNGKEFLTTII